MFFKKFIFTFLFLILFSLPALSIEDTYKKIDIKTAIKLAVTKNLDYLAAQKEHERAIEAIKTSKRFQNPSIGSYTNIGSATFGNPDMLVATELIELGKRGPRIEVSKAEAELVKNEIDFIKFKLKTQVRKTYIELLSAEYEYENLKNHEELLRHWYEEAKKEYSHKKISELEFLQTEVAYNEIIPQLNKARVDIEIARENFNKAINSNEDIMYDVDSIDLPKDKDFHLLLVMNPDSNLPSEEKFIKYGLDNRFDIKSAKIKVEIAEKKLTSMKRKVVPDLEIQGGWEYLRKSHSENGSFKSGALIGASLVDIPLFYMYSPEIKSAKIELEQAELNYESAINKAKKDLSSDYKKFKTAQTNLNYYNSKLTQTPDKIIKNAKQAYIKNKDKKDITAMIVMEQSCREVNIGYIDAIKSYYRTWIELIESIQDEDFLIEDGDE